MSDARMRTSPRAVPETESKNALRISLGLLSPQTRARLVGAHVLAVLIILRANVLLDLLIGREDIYDLGLERRSKAFWIIVCGFHFKVTQIRPPQPVSDVQLAGMREHIQPCFIIQPQRIHDQRVPFPFANRISLPR